MLLAHGYTHRKLMVAGTMELPGGYNIADNLLVRGDAEGTSISIPVAFQMHGATGELLNDGKTSQRTLTFTLPTGEYLSSTFDNLLCTPNRAKLGGHESQQVAIQHPIGVMH
jgi:hypothetical protein